MEHEWSCIQFELIKYKNSSSKTLKGLDTIWELIDEHLMKISSMLGSPYVEFI